MPIPAALYPHNLSDDPDYFRDVLLNMEWIRIKDQRRVRFYTTGESSPPDYQTEYPPSHRLHGILRRYSGHTHTLLQPSAATAFDEAHLSEPYTWDDLLELLKYALERKKAEADPA